MSFAFMLAEKAQFPIRTLARALGVSPSGYYAWHGRPLISARVRRDRGLRVQIRAVHAESEGRYGSPRVHAALQAGGARVSRKRVIRVMQDEHLHGRVRRRFHVTTRTDAAAVAAPNTLAQQFAMTRPNQVWAGDITALPTREGWVYLAVVLDLWSRRVIGWALRPSLETPLVTAALQMAVALRPDARGVLHHSDRGCQYTSAVYQAALQQYDMTCSMSRRGNCYDNAPVESFFHSLKGEIAEPCHWPTRDAAMRAVRQYLHFYNTRRLHSSLGYRSPATFEARQAAA